MNSLVTIRKIEHGSPEYQVDEDGESFWVFESRDVGSITSLNRPTTKPVPQPSRPANPVDSKYVSHVIKSS